MNRLDWTLYCIKLFGVVGIGIGLMTGIANGYEDGLLNLAGIWSGGLLIMFSCMFFFPNTEDDAKGEADE